jgi:hypothetical protein
MAFTLRDRAEPPRDLNAIKRDRPADAPLRLVIPPTPAILLFPK